MIKVTPLPKKLCPEVKRLFIEKGLAINATAKQLGVGREDLRHLLNGLPGKVGFRRKKIIIRYLRSNGFLAPAPTRKPRLCKKCGSKPW